LSAKPHKNVGFGEYCCWFQLILSWAVMVVEERCSLVDKYNGIRNDSIEVLSTSSCSFQVSWNLQRAAIFCRKFCIIPL